MRDYEIFGQDAVAWLKDWIFNITTETLNYWCKMEIKHHSIILQDHCFKNQLLNKEVTYGSRII